MRPGMVRVETQITDRFPRPNLAVEAKVGRNSIFLDHHNATNSF